jgi:hypothetical protein
MAATAIFAPLAVGFMFLAIGYTIAWFLRLGT